MALSSLLGSLMGGSTGISLGKNLGLSKANEAAQGAIQGANFEAQMEITAAQLDKIDGDKKDKLAEIDGQRRKNSMSVAEKNSALIQF